MTESNKTRSKALIEALKQPNGARFYRCALQVNPFAYHGRHAKQSQFQNEADYNAAMVEACRANHIEAIAVTDHYRISDSLGLIQAARGQPVSSCSEGLRQRRTTASTSSASTTPTRTAAWSG
jgi:hypothetical protein